MITVTFSRCSNDSLNATIVRTSAFVLKSTIAILKFWWENLNEDILVIVSFLATDVRYLSMQSPSRQKCLAKIPTELSA